MRFDVLEPRSVQEAVDLLAARPEERRVVAGGTALIVFLKERAYTPEALVSLHRVPGLSGVEPEDGGLRIGAMTRLADVHRDARVRAECPVLAEATRVVANARIRAVATLGGNLCHADYHSDPPGVLLALGARVQVRGPAGERDIPIAEFYRDFYETSLRPGEIAVAIRIPGSPLARTGVYQRHMYSARDDWPCLGVTALAEVDETCRTLRLALAGVANRPLRLTWVEEQAVGRRADAALAAALADLAAEGVDPISDLKGPDWYKKEMVRVCVAEAIERAFERARPAGRRE
ncbi:MAG: xanthine dehydrogenase family protein subunit M [Deltaproteobacteria bacterium]|nr:xanthine dehydrogenase family protein subunit M [Deltaproteobacteria bacterium]MBI3077878.1 xanthine dehydrogenase family protein subunit M [Deltaproteobacteria bacterium]